MLVHPQFNPVALQLGPLMIRWYGLMYLSGFAAFLLLGRRQLKKTQTPIAPQQIGDLLFYGVLGVIIGGRLGYVCFYQFDSYLDNPLSLLQIWKGGMSFHGGLIGVLLALLLYARENDIAFLALSDFVAPLVPIGLGAGRIGNFINGELWGRVVHGTLPWAMIFPQAPDLLPRHPSQLYEFLLEGVLLFLLLQLYARKKPAMGAISGAFLLFYGDMRFLVEFTREPDSFLGLLHFGWSMGQWLSVPMMLCGAWLWWYALRPKYHWQRNVQLRQPR